MKWQPYYRNPNFYLLLTLLNVIVIIFVYIGNPWIATTYHLDLRPLEVIELYAISILTIATVSFAYLQKKKRSVKKVK